MEDPRLAEIDQIVSKAEVDESRLLDAVITIGSDAGGLRRLVDHFGPSSDPRVLGAIAFALSRAAWNEELASDGLNGIVLDFTQAARGLTHTGSLVSTLNALHGLHASQSLRAVRPGEQSQLAQFFVDCLDRPDIIVRAATLDVLGHLWQDGTLPQVVPWRTTEPLRARLAQLAAEEEGDLDPDLSSDISFLREFWNSQ